MAANGTTSAGSRGAKYRVVARAVILGRPIGAPKPTPATITDRAISVTNGNLQPMWEDLLEAVAAAPPPPRRTPPPPLPANARDAPPAVPDDGYDSDGMTELVYKPTDLAAPHLSSQSSPAVDSVVNRMAYSVSRGNPRKAWRLMDESPVMDLSDPATAAAVADLHPQDDEPDLDALTDVPGAVPFRTPRPIFDAVIDKLPSDRAAGMGGAPFEELVEHVEYGHGDTLYAIVCMLNDGTLHPDAWDVLHEPSALIALRKPNGKARPIAMGDVFERVGGRCVLFAKLEGLDEWLTSAADLRRILASDEWRARLRRRARPAPHPDA